MRRNRGAALRSGKKARIDRRRPRPAVFVDRDGTLNREVSYLATVRGLRLLPGAAEGVRRLSAAGFAVVIVTNQSGVARGIIAPADLAAIHRELVRRLAGRGAHVAGIYVCPHHPDVGRAPLRRRCGCRKPAPGLVRRAARELALDLGRSYCVGDGPGDLALAAAIGGRGVLVLTGHGRATARALRACTAVSTRRAGRAHGNGAARSPEQAACVVPNFRAAANWIIDDAARGRARRRR